MLINLLFAVVTKIKTSRRKKYEEKRIKDFIVN